MTKTLLSLKEKKRRLITALVFISLCFISGAYCCLNQTKPSEANKANNATTSANDSFVFDNNYNLLTLTRKNGEVWHFGYTEKKSGVIVKSHYFIVSKVVEPTGKTWTLTNEKSHLWQSNNNESWTGDYYLAKSPYGDYRLGTLLKVDKRHTVLMMIHPAGYVVYANDNGSVSRINLPNGSQWEFSYDESDAKITGDPERHKPTIVKEPDGRTWTKESEGTWISTDGQKWSGEFSFDEYVIGSGVHFATIKKVAADKKSIELISPTASTVGFDSKGKNVVLSQRSDGKSSGFAHDRSGAFAALTWCREPNGNEHKKTSNGWTKASGEPVDAKFSDESEVTSHLGYGSLRRIMSDTMYIWHTSKCDIEAQKDYTINALHYYDGTKRLFWYETKGTIAKHKELVRFQDKDGTLWESNANGNEWKSSKGTISKGWFSIDNLLTNNTWGYGTFMKYDSATQQVETSFSGCPAHVVRRNCTNNGNPRGGGQQCHDDYYVVP